MATADYAYDDGKASPCLSEDSVFALDRVVTLANQLNAGELLNSYAYAFNNKGLRNRWTQPNPIDRERLRPGSLPKPARQATSVA